MALRVLSGILVSRGHRSGSATINFIDHSVTGTLTRSHKTQEIGPRRRFQNPPCKIVSLREIKGSDETGGLFTPAPHAFRIDDTRVTRDYLEIEWSISGDSWVEEISYLIIGEIPD